MPFTVGEFDYKVQRPLVAGLDNLINQPLSTGAALRIQRQAATLARAFNPKSVTYWGVGKVGTDHSFTNEKGQKVIVLDPKRLMQPDINTPATLKSTHDSIRLSNANVASLLGAMCHEVAHGLYTPRTAKLAPKTLAVFRVYEDAYINARILADRLGGVRPLLQYAVNWTMPKPFNRQGIEAALNNEPSFKSYLGIAGVADYCARIINQNHTVALPLPGIVAMLNEIEIVSDKLTSGSHIDWDTRLNMYKEIAAIISRYVKDAQQESESEQSTEQGGDKSQNKSGKSGKPNKDKNKDKGEESESGLGDPDPDAEDEDGESESGNGDDDDSDSESDSDGDSDGDGDTDSDDADGTGNDGDSDADTEDSSDNDTGGDASGDGSGEGEAETDAELTCENSSTGSSLSQRDMNRIAQDLTAANHATEAAAIDAVDVEGIYERAQPGEFEIKNMNKRRIEQFRAAFRAKSVVRRQVVHGTDSGRISSRRFTKLVSGTSENVFKSRPQFRQAAAAVLILIDGSGSMAGGNWDTASTTAYELFKALEGNPDYAVYVWAYSTSGSSDVAFKAAHMGKDGQVNFPGFMAGGTPSHAAVLNGHRFLKKHHGDVNRIIVHFSDLGFGDGPTPEFEAIDRDKGVTLRTISVTDTRYGYWQNGAADRFPHMHISTYSAEDAVRAIEEMVATIF